MGTNSYSTQYSILPCWLNAEQPHRRVSFGFSHNPPGQPARLNLSPWFFSNFSKFSLDYLWTESPLIQTFALSPPAANPILGNTSVGKAGSRLGFGSEHHVVRMALLWSLALKRARPRTPKDDFRLGVLLHPKGCLRLTLSETERCTHPP